MTSRTGQTDHQGENLPERDRGRTDNAVDRPAGTGDTPESPTFWAVIMDGEQADNEWTYRTREAADEAAAYILSHARDAPVRVVPLVLLTAEEREAIAYYIGTGGPDAVDATLRALLARTSDGGNRQ
jgi:hypothetical protein